MPFEGLLNDPAASAELSRLGRARAEGYRWSRSAAALGDHLESLI